jgi:hypothetical protein
MGEFDPRAIIGRLEGTPDALSTLLAPLSDADVRWKPAPEHWSILEVCCHLLDEEREDFRVRLRSTLDDPARVWPPLDLERVAERRGYNTRHLKPTLDAFAAERRDSIAWLRSVLSTFANTDWSRAYDHNRFGPMHAGMLLASWAAHDALHLRQIARRLHELAQRDSGDWGVRYAGDW